ncbi:uncharacterized protein [Ptychodera flava]|uniref:uncharacterized protein n=1 Tax=Ptychodera flava TaxID=63121 RepID=UPI00396A3EAB
MSVKIHILFNFFEKIGSSGTEAFFKGWKHTADMVLKNPHFLNTQLHRNLNEQGMYKYVNYAMFDSDEVPMFRPEFRTDEWKAEMTKYRDTQKVAYPGGYFEIATFDDKPIAPAYPVKDSSLFIISCYEAGVDADLAGFEAAWKDISGASKLSENAPTQGFTNSGLYKRFTEDGKFSYVVRSEFTTLSENKGWDLVELVRGIKLPNGVSGDTSLYQVMPEGLLAKSK